MNVVWPVTALFGTVWILWQYLSYGRLATHEKVHAAMQRHEDPPNKKLTPFPLIVANGTLHCGAGCTLGDMLAEVFLRLVPVTLFGSALYGGWSVEYVFAFTLGVGFQYAAIQPMKHLPAVQALRAALKADALSLTSWQIGMYGWMAICTYLLFHHPLSPSKPLFWCMMQIGMLLGLLTAYPVNAWLIRSGIKEGIARLIQGGGADNPAHKHVEQSLQLVFESLGVPMPVAERVADASRPM